MTRRSTVFIGSRNSVFVTRTRDALQQRGIDVKIIDPNPSRTTASRSGLLGKFRLASERFLSAGKQIKDTPRDQTAFIHFLSTDCFWLVPLARRHYSRVVGLAYGSDILRRKKKRDILLRFGLEQLDVVAATNNNVLDVLKSDFRFKESTSFHHIKFGLPVFDELLRLSNLSSEESKRLLSFDTSLPLISLGYSASAGQRQLDLLAYFSKGDFIKRFNFVVPVQYGDQSVIDDVTRYCKDINSALGEQKFVALTDFHDPRKAAIFRRASDLLINYSISDAFSGTVQEAVYSGNLVLAAEHLPYRDMPGFGTAIRSFKSLDDAASILSPASLQSWRDHAARNATENREQLHRISSWDAAFPAWEKLIARDGM